MTMYNTLKRIYRNTHNKTYLQNAVLKGWITSDQMDQIIAEVDM